MPSIDDDAQLEMKLAPSATDTCDAPLYHYTNAAGLLGIIRSKRLWATHHRYLNDREELETGASLVADVLERLIDWVGVATLTGRMLRELSARLQRNPMHTWHELFISSLSENGNMLSQWRGYADNGGGYSIGLRLDIAIAVEPSPLAGALLQCEYNSIAFQARVERDLKAILPLYMDRANGLRPDSDEYHRVYQMGLRVLSRHTAMLAPRFKNPAFAEEREWRLVAFPREKIEKQKRTCFRASARGIVPYIEIPLCLESECLPITSLYVGPTQDPGTGRNAAELLLELQGYDIANLVETSGIPYRP